MKPQDLNINLTASDNEAVLRIGEAPKIYDPIALALTGTWSQWKQRGQQSPLVGGTETSQ